jgi:hypothetical protein
MGRKSKGDLTNREESSITSGVHQRCFAVASGGVNICPGLDEGRDDLIVAVLTGVPGRSETREARMRISIRETLWRKKTRRNCRHLHKRSLAVAIDSLDVTFCGDERFQSCHVA